MTFFKTVSTALVAATVVFGAMAPISAPAFASDQGYEVKPVQQMKTSKKSFNSAKFGNFKKKPQKKNELINFAKMDKQDKKTAKYLAIGAVAGAIGYALITEYHNSRD